MTNIFRWNYPILLIGLFMLCTKLNAQLGLHSSTIKWQQINTANHKIIFPQGFQQQAFRVANILSYMDENANRSIGTREYPITILLHNQTTIPNGFFRSFLQWNIRPPNSEQLRVSLQIDNSSAPMQRDESYFPPSCYAILPTG